MSMMPFSADERAFNREVGRLVKHWRMLRGYSQKGLAQRLGWHPTSIYNLEVGRATMRLYQVTALAAALDMPVQLFLKAPAAAPIEEDAKSVLPIAREMATLTQPARLALTQFVRAMRESNGAGHG